MVTIVAGMDLLPPDTVVRVQYGGGEEEYRLAQPRSDLDVLFCDAVLRDGGAAPSSDAGTPRVNVEKLECELWTGGSATLSVQADAYAEVERELEAEIDACGDVRTKDVRVELVRPDGGA
jgi:hypothetical protein